MVVHMIMNHDAHCHYHCDCYFTFHNEFDGDDIHYIATHSSQLLSHTHSDSHTHDCDDNDCLNWEQV